MVAGGIRIKAISAKVVVEVEAELGNKPFWKPKLFVTFQGFVTPFQMETETKPLGFLKFR